MGAGAPRVLPPLARRQYPLTLLASAAVTHRRPPAAGERPTRRDLACAHRRGGGGPPLACYVTPVLCDDRRAVPEEAQVVPPSATQPAYVAGKRGVSRPIPPAGCGRPTWARPGLRPIRAGRWSAARPFPEKARSVWRANRRDRLAQWAIRSRARLSAHPYRKSFASRGESGVCHVSRVTVALRATGCARATG